MNIKHADTLGYAVFSNGIKLTKFFGGKAEAEAAKKRLERRAEEEEQAFKKRYEKAVEEERRIQKWIEKMCRKRNVHLIRYGYFDKQIAVAEATRALYEKEKEK